MHRLQVVLLLCTLLYSPLQRTVVEYVYFKPRISGSKHKSSGVVAGTDMKRKKRAINTIQTSLDCFLKRVDRIESSKEPEPVTSMSGMSDIAACLSSPIADDPSALPSPTSCQ